MSWLPNLLRKDSKNTMPSHLHSIRIVCESADGVPPGCTAVKMRVLDRGSVAWDSPVSPVTPSTSKSQRGSCGDDALQAVWDPPTSCQLQLKMQQAPKEGWRKQEVSFQLLLQPSGQPGLWQELSAPISVDLAKHCPPPPATPTPSASPTPPLPPDHTSVAAAQDDRAELSTPIVLEWRSGRQRERQTRMQVLLVCSRGRVEVPPAPPHTANMATPLGVNTKPSPPHLNPTPFSPTPSSPAPSSSFSLTPYPSPRSALPDSPASSMGLPSPPTSMGPQPLAALRVAELSPTPSPPAAAAAAAATAQSVCPSMTSRDLAPPSPAHPPTHNSPPYPTAHPLSPSSSLAPSSGPTTPTHTTASPAATARPGSATGPRAGFEPGTFRGKLNASLPAGQGCGMAPSHEMPVQELVTLLQRMTAPPAPAADHGLDQEHEMLGVGRQPSLSSASGSAGRGPSPAPLTEQPAEAGGVSSSRAAGAVDKEGEAGVGEMSRRQVRQLGAVSLMPPLQAQGQPRQGTDFLMASWGPAGSLPPAQAAPPDSFVMWLGSHTALPGTSLTGSSASTSLHTHSQASDGSAPPATAAAGEGEGTLPTPPAAHAEVRASGAPGSAADLVQHRLILQPMGERVGLGQQEAGGRVAEPPARDAGAVAGLLQQEEQEGVREAQHVLAACATALAAVDRTLAAADTSAAPPAAPAGPPAGPPAAGGDGSQAESLNTQAGCAPQAASPLALSPLAASDSPQPAMSPPSGPAALTAAQHQEGEGVREAQHVLAASRGAALAADRMLQHLDAAATPATGAALLPGPAAAGEEGEGEEEGDAEASLTSLASDHQASGALPPGPSTASTSALTDTTFMMPSRTSCLSRPPPHDSSTSYVPDAPSFRGMPLVQLPGSFPPGPAALHVSRAGSSSLTRNAQLDSAANAGSVDLGLAAGWGVEVEEEEEGMEGGWDMTSSPDHSRGLPAVPSAAGGEGSAAPPPVHRRPASVAPGAGPRRTPQTSRCSSRSLGDVGLVSGGGSGGGAGGEGVVQLAAPVHAWVPWRPDTPSSPAAAPGGSMMQSRPSLHAPPSPADSADSAPPLAPPPFLYTPQVHHPQAASSNDSPQPPMLIPALTAAPEEAMEPPSPSPRPSPARSSSQGSMGLCPRDSSHSSAFLTYYPLQFPAHPCTSPASAGGSSSRASLGRPLFDPHPSPGSSPATSPMATSARPAGPPPQLCSAFGAGAVLADAAGGGSGAGPAHGTHRSSSGPAPGLSHFSTPFATPPCNVPPPTPGMRASSPPPLWGAASAPTSTHPPSAFHRGPSSPERMGPSPVSLSRATSGSTSGSDLPCRGTASSTGERRALRSNQRRASACCPGWDMDGLSRGDMGGGLDRAGSCALPQQQQQQRGGGRRRMSMWHGMSGEGPLAGPLATDVEEGRVPLAFGWVTGLAAAAGSSMAAPDSSVPASEPEAGVGAGQLGSGLGPASGAVQEDQRAGLGSGSGRVGSAEQLRRVASAQYVLAASAAAIKAVDFTLQVLDQPTPGPAAAPAGSGREAAGA